MKSVRFLKTIDIAVRPENFLAAVSHWERLLGERAVPMTAEMNPGGKSMAAHIPLPQGEYACHSIGIFAPTEAPAPDNDRLRQHLAAHGEGVILLAFMVDDLPRAEAEARADGFPLAFDSAQRYAVGAHNFVKPVPGLQDIEIQLAVHDADGYERWKAGG